MIRLSQGSGTKLNLSMMYILQHQQIKRNEKRIGNQKNKDRTEGKKTKRTKNICLTCVAVHTCKQKVFLEFLLLLYQHFREPCMVIMYRKGKDQAGKVANPVRGQLNRKNVFFPVPVRA